MDIDPRRVYLLQKEAFSGSFWYKRSPPIIIVYIIIIVKPGLSGKEQLASSSGHQTWFKVVTIMHLAIICQI